MFAVAAFRLTSRMGIKNRVLISLYFQTLPYDAWVSSVSVRLTGVNIDSIGNYLRLFSSWQIELEGHFNPKLAFTMKGSLSGPTSNSSPLPFSTFSMFLPKHLAQPIAAAYGVKHPNSVPHIALTRGIRAHEYAERPELKRSLTEVFEIV
jgi:hypothetical protein